MKLEAIRSIFLETFKKNGHTVVPSSSLIPVGDDTLLFTNAGMVPFKDLFLGNVKKDYVRATSAQRCVRAGGKHNDLENVGYTARHHTFFEMLGNFSFGDYFKEDAIRMAWDFLTIQLKLPKEKLWVTVFREDDEAADIWIKKIGVSPDRISRCGEKDNFWSMGDTGPCGPCTEIFYDHGESIPGGPPGSAEEDGDRYIEIWNLVFMQYNRLASGELQPLPAPSVDTGMGLERLAAVLQGVHSNYEIDLFQTIMKAAADLLGVKDHNDTSIKVIADHLRSSCFLIADGVVPSNEGRGYVLRRIIRRAARHGHHCGSKAPFMYKLVEVLAQVMGQQYPELRTQQTMIEHCLKREEEQFNQTLSTGMVVFTKAIASLKDKQIPGDVVFKLYDTYGFPVDLTADMARAQGLEVDMPGFEVAMNEQRTRARQASNFGATISTTLEVKGCSHFTGYEGTTGDAAIIALYQGDTLVTSLKEGEAGMVVLDVTPFYAESGGQVGDKGVLSTTSGQFIVEDTVKRGEAICHIGTMQQGTFKTSEKVKANVDEIRRASTARHHSATHLLHAALRQVVGGHVTQKGSLVNDQKLRFDFSHYEAVTPEQLLKIEEVVNQYILENTEANLSVMTPAEAQKKGAMALFGEKYGDKVRVLEMGHGFSIELCGGTHCHRTGDIGLFAITSETGIAAGVRRIEAVCGMKALEAFREKRQATEAVAGLLQCDVALAVDKVKALQDDNAQLEKAMAGLRSKMALANSASILAAAQSIQGKKVVIQHVEEIASADLRGLVEHLKQQVGSGIILLSCINDKKITLIAGVTGDLKAAMPAGPLVNFVAEQVGGKGGGRPELAQAGGDKLDVLPKALQSAFAWVEEKLK